MKVKLSKYAKLNSICYRTAYLWYRDGKIKERTEMTPSGSIFVYLDDINDKQTPIYTYSRVSSNNKKDDLKRQQERCIEFCFNKGLSITKNFKEVASGMNDNRTQFNKLLEQPIGIIIIENKDRLTRFGFNYIETLYKKLGGEIIVINRDEIEENDLMKDLVSVITSFCCRLYGMRRGYNKAKSIKENIENI
jgi:predicted site-specific integrase-resolvase